MEQYRAVFDAEITFLNGGGLQANGFRLDVPDGDATEEQVGALLVRHLGLLMVDQVRLADFQIVAEEHRGSRGGPSDTTQREEPGRWLIELSHVIREGLITYPGLPGPHITPHMTRADSRSKYAEGTEFAIDAITMVGNTGTYLDSPFHRYADGPDLSGLPLESIADLPISIVRLDGSGRRGIEPQALAHLEIAGRAVL
nr:cyclase family protein [Spelaeibacter cavernicola]